MLKKILFIAFTSLFLFSCSMQKINIGNPEGIEVEELSMKSVKLNILVPIENPNNLSFTVKGVNLDLIINDRNVGKVKKIGKFRIPANSNQTYPMSFELTTKDALTNILFLVGELQKRKPKLEVKGTVTVSKFGIPKRIKVEHEQSFERF